MKTKIIKTIGEVDIVEKSIERVGEAAGLYFDKLALSCFSSIYNGLTFGRVIGYRNVRVPRYLTIKLPVVSKDYDEDGEFMGWLVSFEKFNLFKIGTKIEKQPIFRREKGKKIKFRRYSKLK